LKNSKLSLEIFTQKMFLGRLFARLNEPCEILGDVFRHAPRSSGSSLSAGGGCGGLVALAR